MSRAEQFGPVFIFGAISAPLTKSCSPDLIWVSFVVSHTFLPTPFLLSIANDLGDSFNPFATALHRMLLATATHCRRKDPQAANASASPARCHLPSRLITVPPLFTDNFLNCTRHIARYVSPCTGSILRRVPAQTPPSPHPSMNQLLGLHFL